jgi:hypothetical protein
MLDSLLKLVKEQVGSEIVSSTAIPNEKNDAAIKSVADGIFGGLKTAATGDGLKGVLGLLGGGGGISSSLTKVVTSSVVSQLTSKIGLGSSVASGLASGIVPKILGSLSSKTQDSSNSDFDASGILSALTGGKTSGLDVKKLIDSGIGNGDGKLDLSDLTSMFSSKSSGGLGSIIGSFFGKK